VLSKSRIFKFLKRDCGTIPVAEITSGKIEIFSKHQRFLIATDSSKYLLIFVLYNNKVINILKVVFIIKFLIKKSKETKEKDKITINIQITPRFEISNTPICYKKHFLH
jgi:hypothetical protein